MPVAATVVEPRIARTGHIQPKTSVKGLRRFRPATDVLTNFDGELGEAVATLIHAKLCGVDMDDLLREVLKRSGEFARYEEAERETPEDEMVIYPPLPLSAESLHQLARCAAGKEARIEEERRLEARGVTED